MIEPFLNGPTEFSNCASNDKALIAFDRLLRKYFAGEGTESHSHAGAGQVADQTDDASVVSYSGEHGGSRSITLRIQP